MCKDPRDPESTRFFRQAFSLRFGNSQGSKCWKIPSPDLPPKDARSGRLVSYNAADHLRVVPGKLLHVHMARVTICLPIHSPIRRIVIHTYMNADVCIPVCECAHMYILMRLTKVLDHMAK